MTVDIRKRQLALLNFGLPWWTTLPEANGTIDQDDRLHFLHLYPITPTPILSVEGQLKVVPTYSADTIKLSSSYQPTELTVKPTYRADSVKMP